MFLRQLFLYSVCYFVIVALGHVRYYAGLSYERDLRAAQLEGQLAAARLTALQGQLRPHFLFNTLNMIAEQVYTDPAGADAMLTRLGVLLRSSFVETDRERVPLRRELELLESYVEIMQGRFHGRLTFALDDRSRRRSTRSCRDSSCSRSWRTRSSTASSRARKAGA